MKVWSIATSEAFDQWFANLGEAAQAEIMAKVTLLKYLGPALGRPHVDTLKGSKHSNLKELRADTADQILRTAFAFDPRRTAILLIGGDKSGVNQKQFYKRLIAQADELFDEHLATLKPKRKEK